MSEIWDWITGKPSGKSGERPASPPKAEPEKPQPRSAEDQRQEAAKQRAKSAGPAERFVAGQPDVKATALKAKAEREQVPTKNEHQPKPKPRPTMRGPGGTLLQAGEPVRPAPPAQQRSPTNADRMLRRIDGPTPPKPPAPRPPAKSFREAHPNSDRGRCR